MSKGGFLTPKAIGNRIKAKGLQKLRWYCEMCQKQCRDENGFKCHQTSEGHLRQMRIFSENPEAVMERYSKEFEELFLETLSRHHNTKRTHANLVYKEYIADKHHIHMNSTKFDTLTNFVKYLGKKGAIVADETEKGWFISWINRDPDVIAKQEAANKKQKSDMDDEARRQKEVSRRVKMASDQDNAFGVPSHEATNLQRRDASEKISLKIGGSTSNSGLSSSHVGSLGDSQSGDAPSANKRLKVSNDFDMSNISSSSSSSSVQLPPKKLSAMEAMMQQDLNKKKKIQENALKAAAEQEQRKAALLKKEEDDASKRFQHWLAPKLIVKILNRTVADGKYYKLKGEVIEVKEKFIAVVKVFDEDRDKYVKLQLDQEDCETVIPKVNAKAMIVNGRGRGSVGYIEKIDTENFCVSILIDDKNSRFDGELLRKVEYEDVCKLALDADSLKKTLN